MELCRAERDEARAALADARRVHEVDRGEWRSQEATLRRELAAAREEIERLRSTLREARTVAGAASFLFFFAIQRLHAAQQAYAGLQADAHGLESRLEGA